MSAIYTANVNVSGNVTIQGSGPVYAGSLTGNVSATVGTFTTATSIWSSGHGYVSAMVMNDGTVRICGLNNNGQLGQNNVSNRSTVVSVLGICSQAVAVACGGFHTAILMNDGTVRVCGLNDSGQLGLNDVVTRSTVVSVLGIASQAIAVACGGFHTAILMNDGTVRVCGFNNFGQLGQDHVSDRSTVVSVLGICSQAVAVACGTNHIAILMNDGTVRVCGFNNNGQLGQDHVSDRSTVVSVMGICSQAVAVACGGSQTAILMNDGTVRVCGRNDRGQLGQDHVSNRSTVVSVLGICSQAVAVACGLYHTAILMNNGTVRVCGRNSSGQLGQNHVSDRSTVVSVLGICSQAVAVACGGSQTAILMNDGTVRICGLNNNGQLGQNHVSNRSTVVSVVLGLVGDVSNFSILAQNPVKQVWTSGHGYVSAMVMNDGTVRICGTNSSGQLGQDHVSNRSTVVSVLGICSQAVAVACGLYHTAILMNDGTVRVCGFNFFGQLGQNNVSNRSTVVPVLGICSQAVAVACGGFHTAILMNNGTVRVCGLNDLGQLGQDDVSDRSTVVSVLGICSQAVGVAGGRYHTAILMNDGTVRVCGRNNNGQLGQNHVSDRSTVVSVLGICSQAVAVACGSIHTAILMNDGTVRVCGRNDSGQLGQDHVSNRSTVVPVLGICSQAVAVACGSIHTAILMNDGTVRVCGLNDSGQLGLNDVVTRSTVVSVLGIASQAIAVACGGFHTAILMNDGTVRVCGLNSNGQLGLNHVSTRSTVVPVVLGMPTTAIIIAPSLNLGALPLPSFQLDMSTDLARKLTTTTWTTGSDEALKTNIEMADLERCVEIVSKLDLKYFKWEIPSDDKHSLGWIAQEVEQFFPKAVKTADAHGIPDFKNLNSDQLIKVMWGALKKLRADLKAKSLS